MPPKSLTVDGHQYFPIAGDSLSPNITFYDANGNKLSKSGDGGSKYLQSDLIGATQYTGEGSFKTLRSIQTKWSDAFVNNSGGSYPYTATEITDTLKAKLVGGNENTEQVYKLNGDPNERKTPPEYEGVSLVEINESSNKTLGESLCDFWSAHANISSSGNKIAYACRTSTWSWYSRTDNPYYYVLVSRTFN